MSRPGIPRTDSMQTRRDQDICSRRRPVSQWICMVFEIYLAPFAWLVIWPAAIALLVWVLYRLVTGGLKAYHAEPLS